MHNESDQVQEEYKKVKIGPKNFEIPACWKVKPLSYCIESLETGGRDSSVGRSDDDSVLSIGGAHITKKGKIDLSEPVYISEEYYNNLKKGRITQGSILLVKDGATIGKAVMIDKVPEGKAAVNSHVYKITCNENVNRFYVYYYITSREGQNQLWRYTTGSAQPGLSTKFIELMKLQLPPLYEQKKIGEILSTVDHAIAQTDEIIEKTQLIKKGLMQNLLIRGIGHNEFKKVNLGPKEIEIPETWRLVELKEVINKMFSGGTPDTSVEDFWNGKISWTTCAYVKGPFFDDNKDYISEQGLKNSSSKLLPKGNVLFGIRVNVGNVAKNLRDIAISQDLVGIIPKKEVIHTDFLVWYLYYSKDRIKEQNRQGSTISGMLTSDVKKIMVPLPKIEEQKEIAEILTNYDNKINSEEQYKQKLEELKKGLMQDLLTGKKRVTVENT